MSTLEGWAAPTEMTKYADHTFVYCPDNNKYFGCWNGGNIADKKAVKICTGTYANAYAVADCYRVPRFGRRDTAGIGVYLVDGVCHQSANCFLYAAGTVLRLRNGRPGGLLESVAAYGLYGNLFLVWYPQQYRRCKDKKDRKDAVGAESEDPIFQEAHGRYETLRARPEPPSPTEVKIGDFATLLKHEAPEVDLAAVQDLQSSYLGEHEGFLRAELGGDVSPLPAVGDKAVERVNALSAEFQKAFARQVGAETYKRLTGRSQDETVDLIDPRILETSR